MGILDINSSGSPEVRINTKIPFALSGADFTVNIKGFQYGSSNMVSLSIGWHYYLSQFYSETAISNGAFAPNITLAVDENNYVVIHLSNVGYWPKLYVESVYSSAYADDYVANWSWTDAGVDALSSITPVTYKPLDTSITGNAAYATNAGNSTTTSQTNFSTLTVSNNTVATQAWVTSQGYATSFSETDTLATVTGRGATTSTAITLSGGSGTTPTLALDRNIATPSNYYNGLQLEVKATSGTAGIALHRSGYSHVGIYHDSSNELKFNMNSGTPILPATAGTIWGSGNDGAGSGLDADLLDGIDSARFIYGQSGNRRGTNLISNWNQNDFPDVAFLSAENGGTNAPTSDYTYGIQYSFHRSGAAYRTQLVTALYSDTSIYVRNSRDSDVWTSWKRLWHSGDFTSTNISNWNTAYGWGNHAGLYLPLSGGTLSGNLNTTAAIAFRDGAGTYSNIIRAAGYPSEGYDSSQTYWMEYRAYGGHHFVLNVDGGIGSGENAMDDFVIWQGAIDGDRLLELTNAGNLIIRGTFTEQSSIRFKENIQPLEPALAKIEQLNPVTYTKITSQEEEIGLIAEEVAELFPEVVTYNENGQPQGIQYQRLSVILLKAVQELTERVNKLENK
jgi:hypothetical protein